MARGTGSILGGGARIRPACYEARPWHLASPCLLSPSQPDFCRSVQGPSSANALTPALSLFHHLLEEFHLLTCVTASPRLFPASLNPGSLDTPLIPPVLPRKPLKLNLHFLKLYQPISDLCFAETVWPEAGSEALRAICINLGERMNYLSVSSTSCGNHRDTSLPIRLAEDPRDALILDSSSSLSPCAEPNCRWHLFPPFLFLKLL